MKNNVFAFMYETPDEALAVYAELSDSIEDDADIAVDAVGSNGVIYTEDAGVAELIRKVTTECGINILEDN